MLCSPDQLEAIGEFEAGDFDVGFGFGAWLGTESEYVGGGENPSLLCWLGFGGIAVGLGVGTKDELVEEGDDDNDNNDCN